MILQTRIFTIKISLMNKKNIISFVYIFFLLSLSIFGQTDSITPKNIIIFIGDGMGLSQISTEVLSNKKPTVFESFKNIGLVKTHSNSNLITDSGASATAIATGKKTYNNAIGLDKDTIPSINLFELAFENNYSTGILVTSPLTHATPASFYAHTNHRVNKEDIALQLSRLDIDLLVGGGRESFHERESDNKNLLDSLYDKGYKIFDNSAEELPKLNEMGRDQKLIYFTSDYFPLSAITGRTYFPYYCKTAPAFLANKRNEGFILIVESSQLDICLHSNSTLEFKSEMKDSENSIKKLLEFAKRDKQTLLIVTADHETGGLAIEGGKKGKDVDLDYTTNGHTASMVPIFAYGPGSKNFRGIYDNTQIFKKVVQLLGWD